MSFLAKRKWIKILVNNNWALASTGSTCLTIISTHFKVSANAWIGRQCNKHTQQIYLPYQNLGRDLPDKACIEMTSDRGTELFLLLRNMFRQHLDVPISISRNRWGHFHVLSPLFPYPASDLKPPCLSLVRCELKIPDIIHLRNSSKWLSSAYNAIVLNFALLMMKINFDTGNGTAPPQVSCNLWEWSGLSKLC